MRAPVFAHQQRAFGGGVRIAQRQAHQEAVELRFGQREGADLVRRVLRGDDEKRVGPGLGVTLDREKLREYHELFRERGGYAYDRDPSRPGWFAHVPNQDWADPGVSVTPKL